jgi:hypothetical protein
MAETWRVVAGGQRQSTHLNPAGTGFTEIWEVPYEVHSGPAAGVRGIVRIPADAYSAEAVKAAIDEAVTAHHNVSDL